MRAAGEGQAQQTPDLVEGLAGGVVARAAQPPVAAVPRHQQQFGMPARDEQRQQRESRLVLHGGPGGIHVALKVVDAQQRQVGAQRQALRVVHADQQRTDEARSARYGDGVHGGQRRGGLRQGLVHDRRNGLHVGARGQFGEDAAVAGVQLDLRGDDVGEDFASVAHDGRRRLVAGGLDTEDEAHAAGSGFRRAGRPRKRPTSATSASSSDGPASGVNVMAFPRRARPGRAPRRVAALPAGCAPDTSARGGRGTRAAPAPRSGAG